MTKQGYIKLHRQLQECWLYEEKPFCYMAAWVDLLLLANHEDKNTVFDSKPIVVGRGQRITSVRILSERWGWGKDKTLRFLRILEEQNMIIREADSRRTLITIVNYDIYQGRDDEKQTVIGTVDRQLTDSRKTVGRQSQATNKNDKNDKNEKNDKNDKKYIGGYFPLDENLNNAFLEFIKFRKQIKKPMSDRAIDLAINKLNKMSNGDNELAIKIIDQSILKGWQDFYEIKTDKPSKDVLNRVSEVDSWV